MCPRAVLVHGLFVSRELFVPHTASVRKTVRQQRRRNVLRSSQRSQVRTAVKHVHAAVADGNRDNATVAFKNAMKVIDTMAGKRVIHKNAAARLKSRLNAGIRALPQ